MSQLPCKRFWEGPVGITLMPRKQQSGEYFWTFAFTRAFKRKGKEVWEYTEFFGQKHAAAVGPGDEPGHAVHGAELGPDSSRRTGWPEQAAHRRARTESPQGFRLSIG